MSNILTKLEELEDDANLSFLNAEVRRLSDENDRLKKAYDSSKDTLLHIRRVSELLHAVIADFAERASAHDASKLENPEKELFDQYTPLLKSTTYGSTEYEDCLSRLKVALDHHYEKNSHHPEHHPDGICGMNLFDLLEMLVDWKAATERHADGSMENSLDMNVGRFHISHEMYHILKNTIEYMSKKKEWNKNSASEEDARRSAREERLCQLGFEEPTDERRKANLALNVALREWPK